MGPEGRPAWRLDTNWRTIGRKGIHHLCREIVCRMERTIGCLEECRRHRYRPTHDVPKRKDSEMLVLTRKLGQRIVLPNCGVTIDVVNIGHSQVRLGIDAPSDIPVHRREVWDRIRREDRKDVIAGPENQAPALPRAPQTVATRASSPADLDYYLAQWIQKRASGRIKLLSVKCVGERVVISGSTSSYYVRQLVQTAVEELLGACSPRSLSHVEYSLDVVGHKTGDTSPLCRPRA
jgi:carbon storage regulator